MRTSRSRLALVAMALTLALAGAACSSDDEAAAPATTSPADAPSGPACGAVPGEGPGSFSAMAEVPVGSAATSSQLLSTLATAVAEADLVDTLDGDGPFTVFAPANSAFGEIPAQDFDALLADKEQLADVLSFHVVEGDYSPSQLIDEGSVETLEGQSLTIAEQGDSFTVDGAKVLCGNIPVANGVVYVIDHVLTPDSVVTPTSGPVGPLCSAIDAAGVTDQPAGTAAGNVAQLATLATAVDAADLGATLDGDGPFVILAPVEDAFAALPAATLSGLLDDPEALANILTYHVIAGEQTPTELVQEGSVETVQGGDVEIARSGQSFTVNGANVLCGPIKVANGTVYLIDSVLTPPA